MHLKEQYNKTLMVDIGWISTQSRFFQDKTGFLIRFDFIITQIWSYVDIKLTSYYAKGKKLTHEVCVNQTKTLLYMVSTFKK